MTSALQSCGRVTEGPSASKTKPELTHVMSVSGRELVDPYTIRSQFKYVVTVTGARYMLSVHDSTSARSENYVMSGMNTMWWRLRTPGETSCTVLMLGFVP